MYPATTRTFTKDRALSGNGMGAAWHVWINIYSTSFGSGVLATRRRGSAILGVRQKLTFFFLQQGASIRLHEETKTVCYEKLSYKLRVCIMLANKAL
jgi:hypothetical protein